MSSNIIKLIKKCTDTQTMQYFIKQSDGTYDHIKIDEITNKPTTGHKYIAVGISLWKVESEVHKLMEQGYEKLPSDIVLPNERRSV